MQKEIQGHQPRYDDIFERSQHVLREDSPTTELIRQRLADLQSLWEQIKKETEKRHTRLSEAHEAQQYYFDAAEAEAWMSEQELYMMSEEKAKVRGGAVGGCGEDGRFQTNRAPTREIRLCDGNLSQVLVHWHLSTSSYQTESALEVDVFRFSE